jgi:hypothetical protein
MFPLLPPQGQIILRRSVIDSQATCQHSAEPRAAGQSGTNRVIRGGSFANTADNLRAANRNDNGPANRNDNVAARCVSSRARPRLVSTDASPVYDHP